MSKLYYTDALQAAYMAREFEVRVSILNPYYEEDNGQDPFKWSNNWLLIIEAGQDGFEKGEGEIHPDDYHIFEVQERDVMCTVRPDSTSVEVVMSDIRAEEFILLVKTQGAKIIQRQGKQFFTPEKED